MALNSHLSVEEKDNCQLKQKYTTSQWLILLTLIVGHFCLGANLAIQAPFFPQEAEEKGASSTEYGLIFGIYQLTIFVTAPIMGILIGYFGPNFLLIVGVFTNGLACILFGFLDYIDDRTTFVSLAFIIRMLEGLGAAAVRTSAYTIIAAQFPANMNTVFASLQTALGFGLIIAPTIGGELYDLGGFGLPFYVVGSVLLLTALASFRIMPQSERASETKRGQLLKFWIHPSTICHASAIFVSYYYIGHNHATLEPHIRELDHAFAPLGVVMANIVLAKYGWLAFFYWDKAMFHLQTTYEGVVFGVQGAVMALSSPCWGWLCDKKCNTDLITLIGYLLNIASVILIGPMPFLKIKNGIITIIFALILMGFAIGAHVVSTFSGSLRDAEARGFPSDVNTYALVASMMTSSQSLGGFAGPSVGGYLVENAGYITATAVILIMSIALFIFHMLYAIVGKLTIFQIQRSTERQPIFQNAH